MLKRREQRKYKYIIGLGSNCEFAFQFQTNFGFIESSLFNWMRIVDYEKFINALNDTSIILSNEVIEKRAVNMWECLESGVVFHGQKSFNELISNNPIEYENNRKNELIELRERTKYLINKFERTIIAPEKKLFVATFHSDTIQEDDIIKIYQTLKRRAVNFDFLIILEKNAKFEKLNELLKNNSNIIIRYLKHFSPFTEVTNLRKSDYKNWGKIFKEFLPLEIKENKKKFKYMKTNNEKYKLAQRIFSLMKILFKSL